MRLSKSLIASIVLIFLALFLPFVGIVIKTCIEIPSIAILYIENILCSLSASLFAVVILNAVYRITRGDPVQIAINELKAESQKQIQNTIIAVESATQTQREELQDQITKLIDISEKQKDELRRHIEEVKEINKQLDSLLETAIPLGLLEAYTHANVLTEWSDFLENPKNNEELYMILPQLGQIGELIADPKTREKLEKKIMEGSNIKILIQKTSLDSSKKGNAIRNGVKKIFDYIEQQKNLHVEIKGSFDFRLYDDAPGSSVIRIGKRMLVIDCLFGIPSTYCPAFLLKDDGKPDQLFGEYLKYFNNVWSDSQTKKLELNNV